MQTHIKNFFIMLSLGFNFAFIAVWLMHIVPDMSNSMNSIKSDVSSDLKICSSLYQKLGIEYEKWKQIEPDVIKFQNEIIKQRKFIGALREQLLDILAKPQVDMKAVKSKQEEILTALRGMQEIVINHLLFEKKILTTKQQEKLFQLFHEICVYGRVGGC